MLLTEILEKNARDFPEKIALVMKMGYRTVSLSYSQVYELSLKIACLLEREGVRKGESVLILAPNSPYWICVWWGALLRGAAAVPLGIQSTAELVERISHETRAKVVFKHLHFPYQLGAELRAFDVEFLPEELSKIDSADFKKAEISEGDIAEIMYTSGTTGKPKGVILTHKNIYSNVDAVLGAVHVSNSDRFLSILPLSHIFEQVAGFLIPFKAGATVVYAHSRAAIRDLISEYRVTKMAAVPEFLRLVMNRIEAKAEERGRKKTLKAMMRLSRIIGLKPLQRLLFHSVHKKFGGKLVTVASGGAPLAPELEDKWDALGIWLLQGYGLTETSPVVSTNTYDARKAWSVGKVLPGVEIKIASDGEILVRGPNVFRGYFKDEKKTKEAFTPDGWFRTDDMGEMDEEGFLFLKGRKKYMILGEGGQNVYPEDIEFELAKDSRLKDSAVVGLEKPGGRVEIHAVLLLAEGVKPSSAEDIIETANEKLISYQRVNGWSVWLGEDFPRSATRKVKKEEVLAWLREGAVGQRPAEVPPVKAVSPLTSLLAEITSSRLEDIASSTRVVPELNLDSLLRIELVTRIEEKFGVSVSETLITPKTTVADLEKTLKAAPEREKVHYKRWPISSWAGLLRILGQSLIIFPLARIFVKLKVEGVENLKDINLPAVFASNHISYLDSIVLVMALPFSIRKKLAFAAALDVVYEYYKFLAVPIELLFNAFPFPRREKEDIRAGLEYTGWMLDQNYSVALYPEGETSPSGELMPLKRGIGLVAVEMASPIVPMKITGTNKVLPYAKVIPRRRGEVLVKFGKPAIFSRHESYERATDEIQRALKAL